MLTAVPTFMAQTLPAVTDASFLAPAGTIGLTVAVGMALLLWSGRGRGAVRGQLSQQEAIQPVPTEETERELAARGQENPEDDVTSGRRQQLAEAARDP